jgi:hypothetical protein
MRTEPNPAMPIACSLDAAGLEGRRAEIAAAGQALRDVQTAPRQAILRFASGKRTRERLAAIVAAESQCCAFMGFDVRVYAGEVVVTISAPAGAEAVLDDFVAAFSAEARA